MVAKITQPTASATIPRPRLFRLLDRSREARITWIAAPPGAGKTTLATTYVRARKLPCLWYTLDAADGDLATFFYYLALAAPRAKLSSLTPERRLDIGAFTRQFFEALGKKLSRTAVLVFDNYHELDDGDAFADVLVTGATMLGTDQRMLVLSRAAPPPKLARLVATDELRRFDEPELALTLAETRSIIQLRAKAKAKVDPRALFDRSRGWAAGVVLLLEHGSSAPELVHEYLARELLASMSPEDGKTLTRVALPPRTSAKLAAELGGASAPDLLASLAKRGVFVTTLPGRETTYELHPLLRELLLASGARVIGTDEFTKAKLVAARGCAAAGDDDAAITLYAQLADWNNLLALATTRAPMLLAQGRQPTLAAWLEKLPAAERATQPWASYWLGTAYTGLAPDRAIVMFRDAREAFRTLSERVGEIAAWAGEAINVMYAYDDFAPLHALIRDFENLAPDLRALPPPLLPSMMISLIGGVNYAWLQHPQASAWDELATELAERGDTDPSSRSLLLYILAGRNYWTAKQGKNQIVATAVSRLASGADAPPMFVIQAKLARWYLAMQRGEFAAAASSLEEGLAFAKTSGVKLLDQLMHAHRAYIALFEDDVERAQFHVDAVGRMLTDSRRLDIAHHHLIASWTALVAGDLHTALEISNRAVELTKSLSAPMPTVMCRMIHIPTLIERGQHDEAIRSIAAAVDDIGASSPMYSTHLDLYRAQIALATNDRAAARTHLANAFGRARDLGLCTMFTFISRPASLARICAAALEEQIEVETVQALLARRKLGAFRPPPSLEAWPWHVRVYLCGRAYVEVGGRALRSSGKPQARPLELLQLLAVHDGFEVPEVTVADQMWPDADGDRAERAFTTALHRLRTMLGDPTLVRRHAGTVSLDRSRVFVDVWAIDDLIARSRFERNGTPVSERIASLYKGPLLPTGPAHATAWAIEARDRLAARVAKYVAPAR